MSPEYLVPGTGEIQALQLATRDSALLARALSVIDDGTSGLEDGL